VTKLPPILAFWRFGVLAFLAYAANVIAQEVPSTQPAPITRTIGGSPVQVTLTLDRDDIAIPGTITFKIAVRYERGVDVKFPEIKDTLGDFAVKELARPTPTSDDLHVTQELAYSLEPVLPGQVEVPSLQFPFSDTRERADGSKGDIHETVTTPPLPVKVHQVLADVKGPESLWAPSNLRILGYILIAVAVVVLIGLIVRWQRRRAGQPRVARKAAPLPPHVWALAELDILMSEGLLERGRVQEFYYRINAIVRRYIEMRFDLMAGEQTSEEFIRELARSPRLVDGHKEVLRHFVSACDPVKYARYQPDKAEIDWVRTAAREFVIQTAHMDAQTQLAAAPHDGNGHPHVPASAPAGLRAQQTIRPEERLP
jgi:hypothetical protein